MATQTHDNDKAERDRRDIARQQTIQPPQDPDQQRVQREREQRAKEEHGVREQSNNPATATRRQYDQIDQPGLHPANQPDPQSKYVKATRLDLEDITGNPGHRNVNPDAPANSINKATNPETGRLESINEPPGVEPGTSEAPSTANTIPPNPHPQMASINEPPGSNVLGKTAEDIGGETVTPVITSLEPDEATIGEETFDIFVHGTGFTENSVIVFAGYEEPTDLEDDGTLSTGINMDVWQGADVVKVAVKNGDKTSNEVDFTFHAEPAQRKAPAKPKRKGKGVKAKSKSKR
jgi:hypothetical protein